MRKYDKKNKRNIGIILAIGMIIIIIFSYFVIKMISVSKIEYNLSSGSILYDIDKNMIKLDTDGKIKIKWGKNYYLIYNDKNYLLGNNSVVYNSNNGLSLYGKFYEIKDDASVEIQEDETKLDSSLKSRFYKIDDRKYLLVASSIYTDNKELDTSNYLLVDLDKLGNATLNNNEVNVKTFNETIINTPDYVFDIANEILTFGENKIDLKKIIGSTNEYESKDILVDENKDGNGGDGTESADNTTLNNNIVNNTTTYQNDNNGGDNRNNTVVKESIEISKRTSVIRVIPGISSISIDYVVYDPKDEYQSVYVEIVNLSNNTSSTVYLNKNSNNTSISDLSPNTKYRLYFNYTYYEDNNLKNYNYNTIDVTTKVPVVSISLNDITSDNIGYVIKLDNKYNITGASIDLLVDGDVINSYSIGNVGNVSSFKGNIDISNYDLDGKMVVVRLSSLLFDDVRYNTNTYYKFSY